MGSRRNVGLRAKRSLGPPRAAHHALIALIAVLGIAVAAPAMASATEGGHWKEASSYMPITKSTEILWRGKLTVTDSETSVGVWRVECTHDEMPERASTNGTGDVLGLTIVSGCKGVEGCENTTTHTRVVLLDTEADSALAEEGTFLDAIGPGAGGTPSLFIECEVHGTAVEDTCTGNMALDITKLESVTAAFDKRDKLDCTQSGGKATGVIEGSQTATGVAGVEEETPIWLKGGSSVNKEETAKWTGGSLTVVDTTIGSNGGDWGVKCEDGGEGVVGSEGTGSITKMTLTKCEQVVASECNGTDSLEAVHLPWRTQLYMGSKEAISDLLASGGSGEPAFKIKCEVHGSKEEEICKTVAYQNRLPVVVTDENGQSSSETSYPKELAKLTCERGGSGTGELQGGYKLSYGVQLR